MSCRLKRKKQPKLRKVVGEKKKKKKKKEKIGKIVTGDDLPPLVGGPAPQQVDNGVSVDRESTDGFFQFLHP